MPNNVSMKHVVNVCIAIDVISKPLCLVLLLSIPHHQRSFRINVGRIVPDLNVYFLCFMHFFNDKITLQRFSINIK